MVEPATTLKQSRKGSDVRNRILSTASELFYRRGVHAVGIDLIIEQSDVAKASLYRHFRTKDDLIAAFLAGEDADFWSTWDAVAAEHDGDPEAELMAHLGWIGARLGRPDYRGCPQINVAAEFSDPEHPARLVATAHKRELRDRLTRLAQALAVRDPDQLGGQLTVLINGAFTSAMVVSAEEVTPLLRAMATALITAARLRK